MPNGSDIQLEGDSSGWTHGTGLFWAGPVGGTVLDLGSESHVVVSDLTVFGEAALNDTTTAGNLIQIDNADQSGAQVYVDDSSFGGAASPTGTLSAGMVVDQTDNTHVQVENSGFNGISVIGGTQSAAGDSTPGITDIFGSTGGSAQFSAGLLPVISVSNGGKLVISSYWKEQTADSPVFI